MKVFNSNPDSVGVEELSPANLHTNLQGMTEWSTPQCYTLLGLKRQFHTWDTSFQPNQSVQHKSVNSTQLPDQIVVELLVLY